MEAQINGRIDYNDAALKHALNLAGRPMDFDHVPINPERVVMGMTGAGQYEHDGCDECR